MWMMNDAHGLAPASMRHVLGEMRMRAVNKHSRSRDQGLWVTPGPGARARVTKIRLFTGMSVTERRKRRRLYKTRIEDWGAIRARL